MKKPPVISQEDRELFRASVKNVTPIKQDKAIPRQTPKIKSLRQKPDLPQPLEICDLGHDNLPNPVHSGDDLNFMRPGLQTRVIRKLRRSEFPIAATLDLHGLTAIQAHQALHQFLTQAITEGWRCVCIIHGKGFRNESGIPILKNRVNYWLKQYACVLGFCSAQAASGGKGAVYVLLKTLST